MRALLLFALAGGSFVGCDDEVYEHSDRVCDGRDGDCSCVADDWCIEYSADGGRLGAGECGVAGGDEVEAACPADDRAGACVAEDGCVAGSFIFYVGYDGGVADLDDVAAAEAACDAGDLIAEGCGVWVEGP